jgi:hypothetical protein
VNQRYLFANLPVQYLYEPRKLGPFIPRLPARAPESPKSPKSPESPESPAASSLGSLEESPDARGPRPPTAESPAKSRALISRYNQAREQRATVTGFNDTDFEQYPFITQFRFNSYLRGRDIPALLNALDLANLTKPASKTLGQPFHEFLFHRVMNRSTRVRSKVGSWYGTMTRRYDKVGTRRNVLSVFGYEVDYKGQTRPL